MLLFSPTVGAFVAKYNIFSQVRLQRAVEGCDSLFSLIRGRHGTALSATYIAWGVQRHWYQRDPEWTSLEKVGHYKTKLLLLNGSGNFRMERSSTVGRLPSTYRPYWLYKIKKYLCIRCYAQEEAGFALCDTRFTHVLILPIAMQVCRVLLRLIDMTQDRVKMHADLASCHSRQSYAKAMPQLLKHRDFFPLGYLHSA